MSNKESLSKEKDPAPALPLPGEGAINSSPWEGGGWEGVFVCGEGSYANEQSIFNPLKLKTTRKELRKNITEPENILWQKIRNKSLGTKFRRQHGIGRYIVDFYCQEFSLVIELDGDSHFTEEAQDYDRQRDLFMQSLGIETLRFTNQDVMKNFGGVLLIILEKINLKDPTPALPLPGEGVKSRIRLTKVTRSSQTDCIQRPRPH